MAPPSALSVTSRSTPQKRCSAPSPRHTTRPASSAPSATKRSTRSPWPQRVPSSTARPAMAQTLAPPDMGTEEEQEPSHAPRGKIVHWQTSHSEALHSRLIVSDNVSSLLTRIMGCGSSRQYVLGVWSVGFFFLTLEKEIVPCRCLFLPSLSLPLDLPWTPFPPFPWSYVPYTLQTCRRRAMRGLGLCVVCKREGTGGSRSFFVDWTDLGWRRNIFSFTT